MSHFTVMVIGENPEEQLAPFQENNMGDCPKEFLKYKIWDENGEEKWFDTEDDFLKSGIKTEDDDDGYYENPNAKWDWVVLGGRWTGYFKVINGCNDYVLGSPGTMGNAAKKGYADQLKKKYIDLDYMKNDNDSIVTFALIKDGVWYERGRMGWWRVVFDEKDKEVWDKEFEKMFDEIPDDTLISVYDCHI